jgi:hypothetical protein
MPFSRIGRAIHELQQVKLSFDQHYKDQQVALTEAYHLGLSPRPEDQHWVNRLRQFTQQLLEANNGAAKDMASIGAHQGSLADFLRGVLSSANSKHADTLVTEAVCTLEDLQDILSSADRMERLDQASALASSLAATLRRAQGH